MGRKKHPFIDRKNATTFQVVHRSQRDVGWNNDNDNDNDDKDNDKEPRSKHVLLPYHDFKRKRAVGTPSEEASSSSSSSMLKLKHHVSAAGLLLEEDYNYEQHYRPITGAGAFVGATAGTGGHVHQDGQVALQDARSRVVPLVEENVREVPRQLESIALTADCMDEDVARALFGNYQEGEFEEILDDFCFTAAQEPNEEDEEEEETFDYEAHIAQLIGKAKQQEGGGVGGIVVPESHVWGHKDQAFFGKARTLQDIREDEEWKDDDDDDDDTFQDFGAPEEQDDDDDDDNHTFQTCLTTQSGGGVVPLLDEDAERALCRKFEETLAEYDDEELGDLEEYRDEIIQQGGGGRELEGDAQVEAALDLFLKDQAEDRFVFGQRRVDARWKQPASYAALVGTRLVPEKLLTLDHVKNDNNDNDDEDDDDDLAQALAEATQQGMNAAPPPEEILMDGKSYFSARVENPWDCESILSTYSTVDHNPVTIGPSARRRPRRQKSKQTRNDDNDHDNESLVAASTADDQVSLATASQATMSQRRRGESAAEKRARKAAVKQDRQVARLEKKFLKEAFRDEFQRRSAKLMADNVGGQSVLRFS